MVCLILDSGNASTYGGYPDVASQVQLLQALAFLQALGYLLVFVALLACLA